MSNSRKRRRWGVAALILLFLLSLAGTMRYRHSPSLLNRATALRDRLADTTAPSSAEHRQRQMRELRQTIEQFSPEERKTFWAKRRRQFRDWLDDFFRSPRPEQIARLDGEIERMNAFRQQGTSPTEPKGPGWATELSTEELKQREKQWLDLTSAEERALVNLYFQMLSQRQQQGGQAVSFSPWGDAPT